LLSGDRSPLGDFDFRGLDLEYVRHRGFLREILLRALPVAGAYWKRDQADN
jgi:hypothetical protein